ncbi:MAG: hypothetical protein QG573_2363 [Acidobacteriota bacterium]|nr:hypothetical protein [Acidobacteriota bacterium]
MLTRREVVTPHCRKTGLPEVTASAEEATGASASSKGKLLNLMLYEAGWFACVLGAAWGQGGAGAALAGTLLLIHLALARDRPSEVKIVALCGAVGFVLDSTQSLTGRLSFTGPWLFPAGTGATAPVWVLMLWLQLGTTLRSSLAWLSRRYGLAAALGAVGGPVAFLAGERLGAATWGEPRWLTALSLAMVWGAATPLLVFVADRIGAGRPAGYRWPR